MEQIGWHVIETQFDAAQLHSQETVFTIGNGYLGTRGTFEEGYPNDKQATLIHGLYDDVAIVQTELVNCPDWLPLTIAIGGDRFSLNCGEILGYQRHLDLRWGILNRDILWRSPAGHKVFLHFDRMASMADGHVAVLRCQITPMDFEAEIEVEVGFNTKPDNHGTNHWQDLQQGGEGDRLWFQTRCCHSGIELSMAAQLICSEQTAIATDSSKPNLKITFLGRAGQTVSLEKRVTIFTSRDGDDPLAAARSRLASLPSYSTLLAAHGAVWDGLWQDCDVKIEGDTTAQLAIRYNLFQLLISAPRHDETVSIPAKTLSGFAYRGHVFWDTEIFILPFLTLTQPQIARNLLSYRYHTLAGARRKAQQSGYAGAMYAWESASTGDEVTPKWVLGADGEPVRIWCGDIELHITADVAYAVWRYWQATQDHEWMRDRGAEIILDTARFWESRVEWNGDRSCYELLDVIGPDENHERVNNNVFTNRMAQWHVETAIEILSWLHQSDPIRAAELERQLELTPERLKRWQHIASHMLVQIDSATGLVEQFEGFFNLEDVNLAEYAWRTQSMQSLLGVEPTNQRQILKQPDVLMLLYLLRERAFQPHLSPSEYQKILQVNWDYYTSRTDHVYGSSLGPAVHAILACDLNKSDEAYEHFMRAALVDLKDVRGNACEGIHAASTGGVWQAIVLGFAGVRLTAAGPVAATPHLPPNWTRLQFKLRWRDRWYEFDLNQESGVRSQESEARSNRELRNASLRERLTRSLLKRRGSVAQRKSANCKLSSSPLPLNIKAVIFDLDGVLTDTSEFHYRGWQQLADDERIPFDRASNEKMRGLSRRDSLLQMLDGRTASETQIQEMMARKNGYYEQFIQALNPADLLPGAQELLDELRAAGIEVAVGSSSKNARTVIQRLGIHDRIKAIADGYSVEKHKPAPDVFLYAAQQLGLHPSQCLVIEDADSGVAAAIAAGMWVVGLGPVERVGAAHVVTDSLAGVRWSQLLAQLQLTQQLPVFADG